MIVPLISSVLYFAYGSNLLAERFYINNNGTRIGYGRLTNYRLGFKHFVSYWAGGVATIIPDKNNFLIGAIWRMDTNETLDR